MVELAARTKVDLIKRISREFNLPSQEARKIVQMVLDGIIEGAIETGRVEIRRFGTFKIQHRSARVARNPRTNEELRLPPRYVLTFEPSDIVTEKVAKRYGQQSFPSEKQLPETQKTEPTKQIFPFSEDES